jgi:hypothetical protein
MASLIETSHTKYPFMPETTKKLIGMISKVNSQVHPSLSKQMEHDTEDNEVPESASEGFQFLCDILVEMNERVSSLAVEKGESENPAMEEIDSKAVIEAVQSLYDGELVRHAVSEINKATNKLTQSGYEGTSVNDESFDDVHLKCGLQFHPKLFSQMFRQICADKETSVTGAVALACLAEYTCAECAELTGNIKLSSNREVEDFEKREREDDEYDRTDYSANMIRKAIENDAELLKTFTGIAYVGVDRDES